VTPFTLTDGALGIAGREAVVLPVGGAGISGVSERRSPSSAPFFPRAFCSSVMAASVFVSTQPLEIG
jgi:hypothetical protein